MVYHNEVIKMLNDSNGSFTSELKYKCTKTFCIQLPDIFSKRYSKRQSIYLRKIFCGGQVSTSHSYMYWSCYFIYHYGQSSAKRTPCLHNLLGRSAFLKRLPKTKKMQGVQIRKSHAWGPWVRVFLSRRNLMSLRLLVRTTARLTFIHAISMSSGLWNTYSNALRLCALGIL